MVTWRLFLEGFVVLRLGTISYLHTYAYIIYNRYHIILCTYTYVHILSLVPKHNQNDTLVINT